MQAKSSKQRCPAFKKTCYVIAVSFKKTCYVKAIKLAEADQLWFI